MAKEKEKSRQNAHYTKGSIVKIHLNNFLTFDKLIVKFNPKLNVIIGPNGTGKSSIVCAICLVLAGKTSLLGRAKEVKEFIKHGEDSALIEIEIYDEPHGVVISRDIVKTANNKVSSSWKINNISANAKKVEEEVQRLNIQLNNLCQFLPQEKVTEFSKMNKLELLENTERAVCPPQMYKDHMILKEFRNNETKDQAEFNDMKEHLDMLTRKNQRVEQDVKRHEEREKFLEQVTYLEMKRGWTIYEDARSLYENKKNESKSFETQVMKEKKEQMKLVKLKNLAEAACEKFNEKIRACGTKLKDAAYQAKEIKSGIEELTQSVKEQEEEFIRQEQHEKDRLNKIEQQKSQLRGWQQELEQLNQADVQPQIARLAQDISDNLTKSVDIEQEMSEHHQQINMTDKQLHELDNKIRSLNDKSARRLETLRRRDQNLYKAVMWLRQNQGMFSQKVHEPILLELKVRDNKAAEVLENHIAQRDMNAFVCQNADDNKRLISELREKQKMRINSVLAPSDNGRLIPSSAFKLIPISAEMRHFGFAACLKELFDAPEPVMAFLCKQYNVQNLPLGSKKTLDNIDKVSRQLSLRIFYIPSLDGGKNPGSRHSVKKSKYSNKTITSTTSLRQPQYLSASADITEMEELEAQRTHLVRENERLKERLKQLMNEKKQMDRIDSKLREEKQELQKKNSRKRSLENHIQLRQESIRNLENTTVDVEQLKKELKESVQEIYEKKKELAQNLVKSIVKCIECNEEKTLLLVNSLSSLSKKAKIVQKCRDAETTGMRSVTTLENLRTETKEAKARAKTLLTEARKLTSREDPNEGTELKELFDKMPIELAEIESLIHEFRTRAECSLTNEKVIEDYRKRQQEIESVKARLASLETKLNTSRSEIEDVKRRWLVPLKEIIEKINARFSSFFQKLDCAGEVGIYWNHPSEYDTYGIRIRVKFRSNSTLQELDPFRQSGGERSVSTMLYLMALQSLHPCPFRVVDEINQGMDPFNERRVFEAIATSSTEENASQYFLITPKLLPNLSYNAHMTIHTIYNGERMVAHNLWKLSRFLRHRKKLCYEEED